ncbi:MAG: thiamine pyrophosphate-binding protein, partial [Chloroflexi bacterium]|nr:thiamine pyrophosphate-binding protein [Chloroflexota bacterium]
VDFRLEYGNHIRGRSFYVSANLSKIDLKKNRRPDIGILGDPNQFLRDLARRMLDGERWQDWKSTLRQAQHEREAEIGQMALQPTKRINPLHLCRELGQLNSAETIFVADGGDFVGTASYIVQPPGPLTWLDPGPFGTLGVGAGFALGAKLVRPEANVWIIYGDGSVGYTLAEFDTFVRHKVPVVALVGNDAGWAQIAREQIEIFDDPVATELADTDYHQAAIGFGGAGFKVDDPEFVPETLQQALDTASNGQPVLINALIGKT